MSTISSEILHNAVENLDIDQLQEYYLYDESDHKSLLIEHVSESCYRVFSDIWNEIFWTLFGSFAFGLKLQKLT